MNVHITYIAAYLLFIVAMINLPFNLAGALICLGAVQVLVAIGVMQQESNLRRLADEP